MNHSRTAGMGKIAMLLVHVPAFPVSLNFLT